VTRHAIRRWLVLLVLGFAFSAADTGEAAPKKSDAEVKVTARADKPDPSGKQVVTVTLTINKGWHVYANPVGLEDLAAAATVVTIVGANKLDDVKVTYPAGTVIKDKVLGDYKVYEDKVEIKAVVQRAKGDSGALEATAKFQACNDKMCLPAATVKVPVE
jgi:DsbC/DsbD-like thiol-disulfide interchange protein